MNLFHLILFAVLTGTLSTSETFAVGILLPPEQKLERLRPHIGELAYEYVRSGRMDLLKNCNFDDAATDPDRKSGLSETLDPTPRLSAYKEVYEHGGKSTDREANHGIKSYMGSSLVTEPALAPIDVTVQVLTQAVRI